MIFASTRSLSRFPVQSPLVRLYMIFCIATSLSPFHSPCLMCLICLLNVAYVTGAQLGLQRLPSSLNSPCRPVGCVGPDHCRPTHYSVSGADWQNDCVCQCMWTVAELLLIYSNKRTVAVSYIWYTVDSNVLMILYVRLAYTTYT